jgi:hypothetical protein
MFTLDESLDNAEMGSFLASLFRFFVPIAGTLDVRNQITQRLRPYMRPTMRDRYVPGNDDHPAYYIATDNVLQLVLADGVQTQTQANRLVNAYLNTTGTFSFQGQNNWLREGARGLLGTMDGEASTAGSFRTFLVGYSAGGAMLTWVAKRMVDRGTDRPPRLLTFGSPRALNTADVNGIQNVESVRWMNDTDPIPLVPPRFEDAPLWMAALGVNGALVLGTYVHKNPAFSLAQDGTATLTTLPLTAQADVIGSLSNWYFSKVGDPANTHQIRFYEARLAALAAVQNTRRPVAAAHRPPEPPENARTREIRQAERRTEAQIQHAASTQNATPVVIDRVRLFKAVRFNRSWCVAFGDSIISFAGNKRRARHLARAGNDFLRSLPKEAVVDIESLIRNFVAFLNAAVLPGGPSTPPIRVSL